MRSVSTDRGSGAVPGDAIATAPTGSGAGWSTGSSLRVDWLGSATPAASTTGSTGRMQGEMPATTPPRNPITTSSSTVPASHAVRGGWLQSDTGMRFRSSSSRCTNCSSWILTARGPALPGLVRRVTAMPGSSNDTASDPRAGCASTSSANGT